MSDIWNGTKTGFMDASGSSVYAADEVPIDLGGGDVLGTKLASDSTAYTFSATDGDYTGDIFDGGTTATEFTGSGYTQSDGDLANEAITENNTDNRAEFDADDVTFSGLNDDTIQFAIVDKQGPDSADWTSPADDPLIAYITSTDFPLTTNGGDVTISWDANGIVHIT